MRKVTPDSPWPLHDTAATRRLEQAAAAGLPPHTLMERAGLATARLALAIAPHARHVWIACGPGNNGGDGLEAAVHLRQWGKAVHVTLAAEPSTLPPDAAHALGKARRAGVLLHEEPPAGWDLCVDALLGLGTSRPLEGRIRAAAERMLEGSAPVLAVDVPSGLAADTGAGAGVRATHTLSLLTLKPGLFTAQGRDASGQVWFDDLGVPPEAPTAWLAGPPRRERRLHASHKGSYGDVAVIGGAPGMLGAAVLAATGALHSGAGRVWLAPLQDAAPLVAGHPELMVRQPGDLPLGALAIACGCGGGSAVAALLPRVIAEAKALVLDADALNAVATDAALQAALRDRGAAGLPTVLTPHPLEAARLLAASTPAVQADRIGSALMLAERFGCTVVLKGSGTVIATPGELPVISPTGNALLATGGTGDVLAGLVAAELAAGRTPHDGATAAVYRHGLAADGWPAGRPLTAGALARSLA